MNPKDGRGEVDFLHRAYYPTHAARVGCKVIGVGVHIYDYVCAPSKKV